MRRQSMLHAPAGSSSLALHAVSRLLAIAQAPDAAEGLETAIAAEARRLAGADTALLLELDDHEGVAHLIGADPALPGTVEPPDPRLLGRALPRAARGTPERLEDAGLEELGRLLGRPSWGPTGAVAVPVRAAGGAPYVVLVLVGGEDRLDADVLDTAAAFAAAAGGALSQRELVAEQRARAAEQAALARAASALNATLDLRAVLQVACDEARALLGADAAASLAGSGTEGLVIEAAHGLAPGTVGRRVAPGEGLSGRVAVAGRGLLTNDYARVAAPHRGSPFRDVQSAVSVPLRWDGQLRGALAVGFTRARFVGARELALLEAFGEMASAACRNAVDAERLTLAARTDGLTGALNHAAMQEALAHEIERSEEDGTPLSLVLFDLDGFKQVNDRDGHLGGDELLREVARALRLTFRPSDVVARYGGDEFAVVVPDTDEQAAAALARDAVARIGLILRRRGHAAATGATAGVARHRRGASATDLLAAADEALLHGKQELGRGTVVRAADLPRARRLPALPRLTTSVLAPGASERRRLHKRTRQLVMANALGSRLAAMTDAAEIHTAVVEELHRAFGFFLVAAVRADEDRVQAVAHRGPGLGSLPGPWNRPAGRGIIGRVLRTGQMALVDDVREDPDYEGTPETASVRAEMTAPVWIGDRLWGVLNCEEPTPGAFDAEDARLLQTVADQMGAALRSAELYAQLEDAYLGTAEALAAALEAKDAYTASHARSIVSWAEAVGRALGMDDAALRDLRYGAIFHDIGKIAIPEAILDKRGPLDPDERAIMERHTVIGEQILRPVTFLHDVLPIVRHEHERWDGGGYPDRLAGEDIPLGARIVLVCDAFHAMTSDRPYRGAMAARDAGAELRRGAGSQFDPRVVDVFLGGVAAGA